MNTEHNWKKWLKWFLFAVAIIIVYKSYDFTAISGFLENLLGVLMPFIIGILIAYILYFPSKSVEKMFEKQKPEWVRKKARPLSVFAVYLIAILSIIIIVNFLVPSISMSIIDLVSNMPEYYKNFTEYLAEQPDGSFLNAIGAKNLVNAINEIDFKGFLLNADNISNYIKGALGVVSGIFSAFVTFMVSIYVLLERRQILNALRKAAKAFLSEKTCENLEKYFTKTNEVFYKFITSQIIDGVIVGIVLSIAMLLLGVKYAILLGFMIGLFNLIPYVGAIIAIVIALVITFLTGGPVQTIWTGIVIIILQQIDANIINPKIVGGTLRLSPLLVIFAITVGGAYFGLLGMFLAVPVIAVLKIYMGDFLDYKKKKKDLKQIDKA